MLTLLGRN